jgi:hypothetical protein
LRERVRCRGTWNILGEGLASAEGSTELAEDFESALRAAASSEGSETVAVWARPLAAAVPAAEAAAGSRRGLLEAVELKEESLSALT